jgi:CO/xanthine dehydrogenase FAD-binding subunit
MMGIEEYIKKCDEYRDSLITSVTVPEKLKIVLKRYSNTAQSHAVITMAASLTRDGFSLAAALKNSGIYRLIDFEKAIKADSDMSDDDIIEWFKAYDGITVQKDMFGGEDYKRYLLGVTAADMYRHLTEGGRRDD